MNYNQEKSYREPKWHALRSRILERDNYTCCRCGKHCSPSELNVHHVRYDRGKKAYDYLDVDLITLCQGCHAQEHGKIMPQSGWEYIGEEDLGDLIGECDACGCQLRYEHEIYHPLWGYLFVGCECADRLTQSTNASIVENQRIKKSRRFYSFKSSSKWEQHKNGHFLVFKKFKVKIWYNQPYYTVEIGFSYFNKSGNLVWDVIKGKRKKFSNYEEAQYAAFDSIDSGILQSYIDRKFEHFSVDDDY